MVVSLTTYTLQEQPEPKRERSTNRSEKRPPCSSARSNPTLVPPSEAHIGFDMLTRAAPSGPRTRAAAATTAAAGLTSGKVESMTKFILYYFPLSFAKQQ